jgi:diguanylate cyclase (GGDEF)-like protein
MVVVRNTDGLDRVITVDEVSTLHVALLIGSGLLFMLLGAIVYRWSPDPTLGRLFALLSAAFATTLVSVPAARYGYFWAGPTAPLGALLAPTALVGIFLVFPRRLPRSKWLVRAGLLIASMLGAGQVAFFLGGEPAPRWLDALSSLWLVSTLLTGLALVAIRSRHRTDRDALAPMLLGTALSVLPIAVIQGLSIVTQSRLVSPEFMVLPVAAMPVSFAYSILRHQVFGLDALMRRVLLRLTRVVIGVGIFFALWSVFGLLLHHTEAALVAAALTTVLSPAAAMRATSVIDRWLYPPFHRLLHGLERLDSDSTAALGAAIAVRLREVVPVTWAAFVVVDEHEPGGQPTSCRMLGSDGQAPAWLTRTVDPRQVSDRAVVVPIQRANRLIGLLVAGPRIDGSHVGGLEQETLISLARSVAAPVDAALLRERAEDEVRFRQGVTRLTHDLAAAATVLDVLRSTAYHAATVLKGNSVSMWRCDSSGALAVIGTTTTPGQAPQSLPRDVFEAAMTASDGDMWAAVAADARSLAFMVAVRDGAADVCLVTRSDDDTRFGAREQRRALEVAEHVNAAIRRAAEREDLEDQLRHQAFYDSLTGLPNRALFQDRLEHGLARAERFGQQVAVLFVDLDRFKVINDSLGHAAGDKLLVQVATRLRDSLRSSDTIARLGGDEFTVLLEGPQARDEAVKAANRIFSALQAPFALDGQDAYVSASIGISGISQGAEPGRDLMREADIAMYRAKGAGRSQYAIYEDRMSRLPTTHLHLESDLHRALERGELRVHYQPIFKLRDGSVAGMEALVRWEHPEKGLVSPSDFIPLAEETGLIVPIGNWVLAEACVQMRAWHDQFPNLEPLKVSVNLSARQFQDPHLVEHVERVLRESQLHPSYVQLEITESAVMNNAEETIAKLHALKALGIQLAMDDFGTGYSSLAYLKRFPIDVLKIDRSFVSGLIQGQHDLAIVQNVIGLAKALGLTTTAEGIEERSQWMILKQLGCENGQGFIFSKALSVGDITDLLVEESAGNSERFAVA